MDNAISEEGREKLTDALRVGQWPFDRQRLRIDVAAAAPVASGWSAHSASCAWRLAIEAFAVHRHEFEAPWKGLPVATIALGRLDRAEVETLVERVTGGRKLPAEVLAQIVAKTDGVPLFVEELTKNMLESGLLIEEPERYRLDGPLPSPRRCRIR